MQHNENFGETFGKWLSETQNADELARVIMSSSKPITMHSRLGRKISLLLAVGCLLVAAVSASPLEEHEVDTLKHHRKHSSKKHTSHDDLMREEWSSIMGW